MAEESSGRKKSKCKGPEAAMSMDNYKRKESVAEPPGRHEKRLEEKQVRNLDLALGSHWRV